jgi:hypothetical protein
MLEAQILSPIRAKHRQTMQDNVKQVDGSNPP